MYTPAQKSITICALVILCVICSAFFTLDVYSQAGPKIESVAEYVDFGSIPQGEIGKALLQIKNTGTEDLIIRKLDTCCGYKIINVSSWTIKPGAFTILTVACDTSRKSRGKDQRYITVNSNDPASPELKIKVLARIVKPQKPTVVQKQLSTPSLTVEELNSFIVNSQPFQLIDVREESEFAQEYISGAINFPKSKFESEIRSSGDMPKSINKDSLLVINCAVGVRSSHVTKKLLEYGYNAFNLTGGITAWKEAGFLVVKGVSVSEDMKPDIIDLKQAYHEYLKGKALWIDARQRQSYDIAHIEGAINISSSMIKYYMDYVPKDRDIIVYCQDVDCTASDAAADFLMKNGYSKQRIKIFKEGMYGWQKAGYPAADNNK